MHRELILIAVCVAPIFPGVAAAQFRPPSSQAGEAGQSPSIATPLTGDKRRQEPGRPSSVPVIDDAAAEAHGIRKLTGTYLTLYTDLPPSPAIEELPRVFDAAVPQWCAYFGIPAQRVRGWKNIGSLMQDKARFARVGLLPDDLPPFPNGYQRGASLWLYEQPSDYYRRHLLLHEGTHAFVHGVVGGEGPPWYFEGVAELLATHRWQHGQLELNHFPANKESVPEWGRIKIIRDAVQEGKGLRLEEIMQYDVWAHLHVEAYGWSWAAAAFFDGHPAYRAAFRRLASRVKDRSQSFSQGFRAALPVTAEHLRREWQLYCSRLDYGYDVEREAIVPHDVKDLPDAGGTVTIAANRGWQSTGWRLQPGRSYRFEATGRYELGQRPKTWWCEPNGVTIRYCAGRPLGMLLGAIVDEQEEEQGVNGFLKPAAIGTRLDASLRRGGTLYLRINDYPSELADNRGEVSVRITPLPAAP